MRRPLVILAIVAADIELVKRWTTEGYMPTLAGVMHAGCFLEVDGADLVHETGSWVVAVQRRRENDTPVLPCALSSD